MIPYKLRYVLACLNKPRDVTSALRFLFRRDVSIPFIARLRYVAQIYSISLHVWCVHTEEEILEIAAAILATPPELEGVVVEAGCYKGGSTAKLSLAARLANRRLVVFDSFEGLPDTDEPPQRSILGESAHFKGGLYRGAYAEVIDNVRRFGDVGRCRFVKGWFEDTMPGFAEDVVVGFLDVDLASSTRTCIKFLFPRLRVGGSLFSQDGHLPLVIDVLEDDEFWKHEVGRSKPPMDGLRTTKLVRMVNR